MPEFAPISQTELFDRRQMLRHQRRIKFLQTLWRSLSISGLTAGLVWLATLPNWLIRNPDQIEIHGNKLLSTETIQALLPIAYPQSLLEVKPQEIAAHLKAQAPIAEAIVSRRLFPSGLEIQVQERHPVAISLPDANFSQPAKHTSLQISQVGLLDENGIWMPQESFTLLDQTSGLPSLKVRGMREQYRSDWTSLYQTISHSPIEVFEIDWREPSNLILHTELGIVHFGPYTPQFTRQLAILDQMRNLNEYTKNQEIAYIDLNNPNDPAVQIVQADPTPTSRTP